MDKSVSTRILVISIRDPETIDVPESDRQEAQVLCAPGKEKALEKGNLHTDPDDAGRKATDR